MNHHAHIAIRHECGRQRALDERQLGRRHQALEPERRLELARADLEVGTEAGVEVGVLQHGRAAAEIGHDAEVELVEQRGLDDRPDPAHHEGVDSRALVVLEKEAAVRLNVTAKAAGGSEPSAERNEKPSRAAWTTGPDFAAAAACSLSISIGAPERGVCASSSSSRSSSVGTGAAGVAFRGGRRLGRLSENGCDKRGRQRESHRQDQRAGSESSHGSHQIARDVPRAIRPRKLFTINNLHYLMNCQRTFNH